jgi:hypothetical protein
MPVDQRLELHQLLPALVEGRLITPEIAQRLSALPASNTLHPLESIAAQGLCLETLTEWLAQRAGQPYLRIDPLKIDVATVVPLMSHAFAQRHAILAVAVDAQTVTVASAQPHVTSWEAGLSQVLKRSIKRVVANPQDITRCIGEFYRLAKSVSGADQKVVAAGNVDLLNLGAREQEPDANDAHIVNIVDWLLQYAFAQRASDIHIEPCREQGRVRFRIDGLLHDVYQFPPQVTMAVVSRLKSLGRMNVAEKRRPQDGRVKTKSPTGAEVEQIDVASCHHLLIGSADGLRQPVELTDTARNVLGIGDHAFDRTLEHLRKPGFPTGDMGLGAGDGDGLGIHRHREDGVALGERVGHQWHYRRHVDFQWVDAQIRLPGPLGEPFGQGFQAQALGCDALQWVQGVAGRQRRQALGDFWRDQPPFDQSRQQLMQFQSLINRHEGFPGWLRA